MKGALFIMNSKPEVLLNFCKRLEQSLIYNLHTFVGFLLLKYEEGSDDVKEIEEVEFSEMIEVSSRSSHQLL